MSTLIEQLRARVAKTFEKAKPNSTCVKMRSAEVSKQGHRPERLRLIHVTVYNQGISAAKAVACE